MKTSWLSLGMILVFLTGAWASTNDVPSAAAQEQMLMEAVMFQKRGFYSEAEPRLKRLAELQPGSQIIKDMLADVQAKLKAKEQEPAAVLKRKLDETIVPEVNFREAAAADVIVYLQGECGRLATDKTPVNFVWAVPADVKPSPVTLHLTKIPLVDVLRYVTQLAGLNYRLDSHAVVIYKAESATPNVKPE